jgi:hypothetical protein
MKNLASTIGVPVQGVFTTDEEKQGSPRKMERSETNPASCGLLGAEATWQRTVL